MRSLATSWPPPSPDGRDQRARPAVFVDHQPRRAVRVDHRGGVVDVGLVEQARGGSLEDRQIGAQILQLEPDDSAVRLLPDEHQVEHANDAAVDQLQEERQALAGRAAVRELDHREVDRAHVLDGPAAVARRHCISLQNCQGMDPP